MRVAVLPLLPLLLAAGLPAQEDVLAIEQRTDLRRYVAAVKVLQRTRMQLSAAAMTPRELCRTLTAATAEKVAFVCSKKTSEAAPPLEVEMQRASLWSIMAVAQNELGLRFVFRHGLVFLVEKDAVKPLTYLRIYNLRGQTMPLRSFPGPDLRLRTPGDDRPLFPEEVESGTTVSGFTAEDIETLLREHVRPESWEREGVTLVNQDGLFLIRQTPQVHREIERLLVKVGLIAPVRVVRRR